MTRRKENTLIGIATLLVLALLTWWRFDMLTMRKDTGPLPEGQRSFKRVELYVGSTHVGPLNKLIKAFELAHGVQVLQIPIEMRAASSIAWPSLNSSCILLLSEELRSLWLPTPAQAWQETPMATTDEQDAPEKHPLTLIHFPESDADPNVMEVVRYLTGKSQVDLIYGLTPE